MSIADDIVKARDAGHSDSDILTAISGFAPQYSADIKTAIDAKHDPKDIVDALGKFDSNFGPEASKSTASKLLAPIQYGAGQMAEGIGDTLHTAGVDGTGGRLKALGASVLPDNYTPANVDLSWRGIKDIPKAIGESLPGLASDASAGAAGAAAGGALGSVVPLVGTAVGAGLGGAAGWIGSTAARSFGPDAKRAAAVRTGDPNAEPSAGDYVRAAGASVASGLLGRFGFKGATGAPLKAAEGSILSQAVPQIAKGAAYDAATGAAATATHEGLIEGHIDPSTVAGAGLTGAVTGAGVRTAALAKDFNAARKFSDITPEEGAPVAADIQRLQGETPDNSPSGNHTTITQLSREYQGRADYLSGGGDSNVNNHIKQIKAGDQSDATGEILKRVREDIAAGDKPRAEDMAHLTDTIGTMRDGAELIDTLNKQTTLNKVKAAGNFDGTAKTFSGGAASSKFAQDYLNPLGKWGGKLDAATGLYALTGGVIPGFSALHSIIDPVSSLGIPAAQIGAYSALKARDRFNGNSDPTKLFTDRYQVPDFTPSPTPSGPHFNDVMAAAQAQSKATAVAAKAAGKQPTPEEVTMNDVARQVKLMKGSQRMAELQANIQARQDAKVAKESGNAQVVNQKASDAAISRQASLMRNSQAVEEARKANVLAAITRDAAQTDKVARQSGNAQVAEERATDKVAKQSGNAQTAEVQQLLKNATYITNLMKRSEGSSVSNASFSIKAAALRESLAAKAAKEEAAGNARDANELLKAQKQLAKEITSAKALADKQNKTAMKAEDMRQRAAFKAGTEPSSGPKVRQATHAAKVIPEAPTAAPNDPHGITATVTHQDGTRTYLKSEVRGSHESYKEGVLSRADARRSILEDVKKSDISDHGQKVLDRTLGPALRDAFKENSAKAARGVMEGHLDAFSEHDQHIIRKHLLHHVDPTSGHTFYNTWS